MMELLMMGVDDTMTDLRPPRADFIPYPMSWRRLSVIISSILPDVRPSALRLGSNRDGVVAVALSGSSIQSATMVVGLAPHFVVVVKGIAHLSRTPTEQGHPTPLCPLRELHRAWCQSPQSKNHEAYNLSRASDCGPCCAVAERDQNGQQVRNVSRMAFLS
ncbi:hypothetical protein VTI74DRAFT_10997 [Chaetomium olivicolor]